MEKKFQRVALVILSFSFSFFISCSTHKKISKQAHTALLNYEGLNSAHIGIAVYDPAVKKYVYNYQGDKYFIPASNTKLFTLYAGLKYLGDSLVAARYQLDEDDGTVILQATGDPTFLHPDFKRQPLMDFLRQSSIEKISINTAFAAQSFGRGWAWDDYKEGYMAERDPFPMYGNVVRIIYNGDSIRTIPAVMKQIVVGTPTAGRPWTVNRRLGTHFFSIDTGVGTLAAEKSITIAMERGSFAPPYLADTLHKNVVMEYTPLNTAQSTPIYSQPKDSLFKIMMHRSDNFFAEQTLLMVSNEKLGTMNDVAIIDTLLKTDLKDLPQKPKWVDGSGLSRYNLFSPNDFTTLLDTLQNAFGLERLKVILPGANEGTLEGLYKGFEGKIFAKTGTLSNNIALSGYVTTKKNKQLLFSVLINNHQLPPSLARRQIEKFITGIINSN